MVFEETSHINVQWLENQTYRQTQKFEHIVLGICSLEEQ